METEKAKNLAEHIANFLQESETKKDDFSSFHVSLEKINQRLDQIESQISAQNPQSSFRNSQSNHPSQHKFEIAEADSPEMFKNLEMEKACPYEPTGKPCDHCAMCSSRGF